MVCFQQQFADGRILLMKDADAEMHKAVDPDATMATAEDICECALVGSSPSICDNQGQLGVYRRTAGAATAHRRHYAIGS
jgi:hypothetical protein